MRKVWVAMLSGLTYMPWCYGETISVEILTHRWETGRFRYLYSSCSLETRTETHWIRA